MSSAAFFQSGAAAGLPAGLPCNRAGLPARRALAAGIRRSTCSAAEATYVQRCDDQPAADPACCLDCPVDPAPAEQ